MSVVVTSWEHEALLRIQRDIVVVGASKKKRKGKQKQNKAGTKVKNIQQEQRQDGKL